MIKEKKEKNIDGNTLMAVTCHKWLFIRKCYDFLLLTS